MSPERSQSTAARCVARCVARIPVAITALFVVAGLQASPAAVTAGKPVTLVVCAPGYPGTTAEAQPAMDTLAAAAAAAAGWKSGELHAIYFETEKGGLYRLAGSDTALALVPLAFWLEHHGALKLEPQLQAVQEGGEAAEPWTLVAASGRVKNPGGLAGFEIISLAGYSSRFVRGPALGSWGELPPDVTITFSGAVLTGLRRASTGNKVALLLDREQAAAVPTLPFAAKLEVVTRSTPLPVSVLCAVGGKLPAARLKGLVKGLMSLGATPAGAEALAGVRLARFVAADQQALTRALDTFARVKE
ncbi:MAG: hypothetical protein IMZ44_11855 [Planctomycetes bacterium]|nr:hypothetical protein [Planctomycetota bacterium]